jgi:hemerythrin-like domain-containing protein
MNPRELAEWLRQEHDEVQRLSDALRRLIATQPRSEVALWLKTLKDQFAEFHAHAARHFAMEEEDGYLLPVLERRPTMSTRVRLLAEDHQELLRLMKAIEQQIAELLPTDRILITEVRDRLRRFLGFCEDHEREENMLVSHVLTHDEGTKD